MVEMTQMIRRICLFAGVVLPGVAGLCAQQPPVEARIAGLEGNAEYMSLLEEDARLQMREDSVVNAVENMRRQLRENPSAGRRMADEILESESRIFEIRTAKGRLIDRINTIEQEWVLANLGGAAASSPGLQNAALPRIPESEQVRNLVDNAYFRTELPAADYAALLRSQRMEPQIAACADRYFANYEAIDRLADAYRAATAEADAVEIYGRYETLRKANRALADSLSEAWNYVFDNKNYAYGYLLDKLGREEMLEQQEEEAAKTARTLAALSGETVSDKIVDYFLRKQMLVEYETAMAELLGLGRAADSLRGVTTRLQTIGFCRPPQELEERCFIEYEEISFPSKPRYTAQRPIPECKVYARGTIYRVLLGSFKTKRSIATFRGASPLSFMADDAGKWRYFAGGFATRQEAETAQALLKKRGFVRPEIVVWHDGVCRNISVDGEVAEPVFRVEIASSSPLSEEVKRAVAQTAPDADVSRAGQKFVVGMFDDRAIAERVEAAVRRVAPEMEIKIAEMGE